MKIYVEDTVGSKVWARCTVPNPPERYVGGLVVDGVVEGRPMKVTLPPEEMVQEEVVELRDVEDLCDLGHVHEATILEAIEAVRRGRPCVAAGDVVLAVNPFKWLPLYTEDLRALHSDAPSSDETRRGARLLHGSATKTIVAQVLRAGPLLESFGNAATLRNGNSSRFAKFLRVEFDRDTMAIESSWCETALLEKTRVVERASGERTYHVFYEHLRKREADAGRLDKVPSYLSEHPHAVADASAAHARGKDDLSSHGGMVDGLRAVCGLDDGEVAGLLHCVDAVLALGDVRFDTVVISTVDDDGCKVVALSNAATRRAEGDARPPGVVIGMLDLFGFEFYGAAGSANGFEQLLINLANERLQQRFVADVLARAQRELLAEGVPWTKVDFDDNAEVLRLIEARAGLVDILNEECVRGNSGNDSNFVDKLLNFHKGHACLATPKIKQHSDGEALPFTIAHYAGTVMYTSKGWVERNRDVLPTKLVEAMTTPVDGDGAHRPSFVVDEKASLSSPVALFAAAEAANLLRSKFGGGDGGRRVGPAAAPGSHLSSQETVGSKFRSQLRDLMRQIAATKCRYVRCIRPNQGRKRERNAQLQRLLARPFSTRPNDAARPIDSKDAFHRLPVVEQLRCCGVLSALRVARAGYPDRKPLRAFVERFAVVGPAASATLERCRAAAEQAGLGDFDDAFDSYGGADDLDAPTAADLRHGDDEDLILDRAVVAAAAPWKAAALAIVDAVHDDAAPRSRAAAKQKRKKALAGRVFVGRTKVFLRDGALDDLEPLRAAACFDRAATIQALARRHLTYAAFKRFKARLLVAQTHGRRGSCARSSRNRVAFVLEMKSKGERLDSLQSKLKNLGSPSQEEKKAPLPPPPRQKGSAVARGIFSSNARKDAAADLDREKQKEILEKARAEAAATVAAAREVATEASRALEELRSENAALRERCAGAEARAESWRAQATKAKQREAQLLAIVDEAKRECVLAREQTSRHLDESSALHGTDAHQSYGRLRQKLLQHSAHMAPALRKKLLEKRKPQQKVTVTQAELRGFVEALVAEGVHVLKHSTNGKAQKRKLKLTDGGAALYWEKPGGGAARSKGESYPLSECVEVRGAHDLDPAAQGKLLCGTKTLRKSMSAKNWPLAFSFIYAHRTIDVEFSDPEDTKLKLRYFKAPSRRPRPRPRGPPRRRRGASPTRRRTASATATRTRARGPHPKTARAPS
ncbi:hypothetical protein JL722_2180 [Aureococcus anophagefferens]|nr:hypothetical protein JL722_2180 [Aureococcus anophagefferens]